MAKRILVPLGGRDRDDAIVPVVEALGRMSGATVRLLRVMPVPEVVEAPNGRVVAYVDQQMARASAEGLAELRAVAGRLEGVAVEPIVRFGEPVDEILEEADAFNADLIALTRTARGRRWTRLVSGVADRVARRATVPTLVLGA